MTAVRLSPSGPNIGNLNGTPLSFGSGARLRLTEAQTTVGNTNVIPTAPAVLANAIGGALAVGFSSPLPGYQYRATVLCDVINPSTNVLGEVQLYLDTSIDGGANWVEQASNTHIINSTEVAPAVPTARQIRCDMALKLGSLIGVTSAPATTQLLLRARIGASSGGNVLLVSSAVTPGGDTKSVGTVLEQLEECF